MARWLGVLLFLAVASCVSSPARSYGLMTAPPASTVSTDAEGEVIRRSVAQPGAAVYVWCEEHNQHELHGSAVYVGVHGGKALFVTAAHVVNDEAVTTWQLVPSLGGIGVDAEVVVRDDAEDVAVLAADPARAVGWAVPALMADPSRDYEFHKCVAYGHPDGVPRGHLSEGWISARVFGGRYQVSAPIFFGNSGGGVYVYYAGAWQLLGVAQQVRGNERYIAPHVALISSPDAIRACVKLAAAVVSAEVVK